MPVDLYQWEAGGGLVHHCPQCFKPLTTPQARSRCLGDHVEWCKRYHTQLFKKGTSRQCAPCRNSDEQHHRRHREIAELVHKLHLLNDTPTPATPISTHTPHTPSATKLMQAPRDDPSPLTKKERKAAKKARKVSELPKAVDAATIEQVGKILHPNDHKNEDGELEAKLLEDADIKVNRFFHKGTSNVREIRNEFVKKDRKGGKVIARVEPEEMEGLLQLLNVSPVTARSSQEEKRTLEQLKLKIEGDLLQAQEEMEGITMRKGGFWRWASKKAYDRLVANGDIWEKKGDGRNGSTSGDESGGSTEAETIFSTGSGDATDDTNVTEPDSDGALTPEDDIADGVLALSLKAVESTNTPKTPKGVTASAADDDGWTSVATPKGGKSKNKKKAAPPMKIKLTPNNGLAKMVQSSTPRTPGFLRFHSQDE